MGTRPGTRGQRALDPLRIDRTERISVGEVGPDCGPPFTGQVIERERIVEDIEPGRPTIVTRYIGLRVSKGQLSSIVAEVARLFGPAYAWLIHLMR